MSIALQEVLMVRTAALVTALVGFAFLALGSDHSDLALKIGTKNVSDDAVALKIGTHGLKLGTHDLKLGTHGEQVALKIGTKGEQIALKIGTKGIDAAV
jgi:hypothetical protein